jgi:hypothetical protein
MMLTILFIAGPYSAVGTYLLLKWLIYGGR